MRLTNILLFVRRSKMYFKTIVVPLKHSHFKINNYCNYNVSTKRKLSTGAPMNMRIPQDQDDSDNEADQEYYNVKSFNLEGGYARDFLYKNSKDLLLNRIYNCVSIQELFNVFINNFREYNCKHMTQTVLVLYDLKKIHDEINNIKSQEFYEKLQENDSFQTLLKLIENRIFYFDANTMSYVLLYLNKLGMSIDTPLLQLLSLNLEEKLRKNFSISPASRFLEAVFNEASLRSYLMSQNLIPLVLNKIDSCYSTNNLNDLTVSLNKLHNVVTEEYLDKYKEKVENFINKQLLTSQDYKIILQIIAFLNYPKWRDKNSSLISKCILLIKNNLNALDVNEIILLYEIFFKIQEPGEILSELQRSSSKHFHQLDEGITPQKITLFSTIIFFASPNLRNEFQKMLETYVRNCNDLDNLLLLRKLLSYIKISDINLCHLYWDKVLKFLRNNYDTIDLLKLSHNYMNFSIDIDNYRHPKFEKEILEKLENLSHQVNYKFFPQKLANVLSFVFIYGTDKKFLNYLVDNLEKNWEQLRHVDCLKLSISLRLFREMDKKYIKQAYAQRIDTILDKIIYKNSNNEGDLWKNNALLKACIFKNNANPQVMTKLLMNYKDLNHISSKNIESITYCFHATDTLIPEVVDNVIDYIIKNEEHILGFNVGRVAYLCFYLGYYPNKLFYFLKIAANIVIRDQERLSGLALIQCALALCFFNNLPNSLIKSIFNVEFMDKLDHELQNCYSKDKYPQRVRNSLMQLNRAVCLDYPECNVPWFHQKYINEIMKDCPDEAVITGETSVCNNCTAKDKRSKVFAGKVREYLIKTIGDEKAVTENVVTPYGYEIDFEVLQDSQKLAVLLIPEFYYTRICVQLKGAYQLKKRHLEMLGYRVVMVNFSDWISLFYAGERIDYLTSLIWPKTTSNESSVNNR